MSDKVNVAVVGISPHMEEHLIPCLMQSPEANPISFATSCGAKKLRISSGLPRAVHHIHWRDAVTHSGVDAVFVAGPPLFHEEVFSFALKESKHLFVEKPCASSLLALKRQIATLGANPKILTFVNYNYRFSTAVNFLLEATQKFGPVRKVHIEFVSNKPRGPIWDFKSITESLLYAVAIHPIELATAVLSENIQVQSQLDELGQDRQSIDVLIKDDKGRSATLRLGNYSPKFTAQLQTFYEDGTLGSYNFDHPHYVSFRTCDRNRYGAFETTHQVKDSHGDRDALGYQPAVRSFLNSVSKNEPSKAPISGSLSTFKIINEIVNQAAL